MSNQTHSNEQIGQRLEKLETTLLAEIRTNHELVGANRQLLNKLLENQAHMAQRQDAILNAIDRMLTQTTGLAHVAEHMRHYTGTNQQVGLSINQGIQQVVTMIAQLQQQLSISRPGIYNHPTHGLQYPNQSQHPANWQGHGMQINDGFQQYMGAHRRDQMHQSHAFSGQHSYVHRKSWLCAAGLKSALSGIPTQQNWITSIERKQLLTTLGMQENSGDPTQLVSDLGLSSCVAPYFAHTLPSQRERHIANYSRIAETMNRLQNGRSMEVVTTEIKNLKSVTHQWVKDFYGDIAKSKQVSPLLYRSPLGEMIAFIPVPTSQLLLIDAERLASGHGNPEMALEMSYLVTHLGYKEPSEGDTEGLIKSITSSWAHIPGTSRGCYLMEIMKLSDALGSSELPADHIRDIDSYDYAAPQHFEASFQDFRHVTLRRIVMIHVPDMVKQY